MMAYQHEKYIRNALDGLLAQTCTAFKLVAIDDGSKDDTYSILKEYEAGPLNGRMTVLTHPGHANRGIYAGYRRCLQELDTEFFMPHASDDFLLPNAIEYLLSIMDANNDVDFIYGPCHIVDSNSAFCGQLDGIADLGRGLSAFYTLLKTNPVREPSMFFRAKCASIIRQSESSILYSDWLHNLAFYTRYSPLYYEKPIIAYRHHGQNVSIGIDLSTHSRHYRDFLLAALASIPTLIDSRLEPLVLLVGSSVFPPPFGWPSPEEAEHRVRQLLKFHSHLIPSYLFDRQTLAALPPRLAVFVISNAGRHDGFILALRYIVDRKSLSCLLGLLRVLIFGHLKQPIANV